MKFYQINDIVERKEEKRPRLILENKDMNLFMDLYIYNSTLRTKIKGLNKTYKVNHVLDDVLENS